MRYIKFFTIALALMVGFNVNAQTAEKDVTIVELTQITGEFETQDLTLLSGKYQFRVVNKDVDKEVGFVIKKASDSKKGCDDDSEITHM